MNTKSYRYFLVLAASVFLFLGLISAYRKDLAAIDRLTSFILIISLSTNKKINENFLYACALVTVLMIHEIGNRGIYSMIIFGIPGDVYAHFLISFVGVIAFREYFGQNETKKIVKNVIAISMVLAIGSVIEINEYWGYRIVGAGPGMYGFGAGDDSKYFGAWGNSIQDMTSNLAGALTGIMVYSLIKWSYNKNFHQEINKS